MRTIKVSINPGTLSHELRTPLTAILGLAQELTKQKLSSRQRNSVNNIYNQGERLFKALNTLLFNQYQKTESNSAVTYSVDIGKRAKINSLPVTSMASTPIILVIDDEPLIQRIHSKMLEKFGYQVETAKNGEEALALYRMRSYAAILTDIHMPGITGMSVATEIRRLEMSAHTRIPIIGLTADVTEQTKEACLAAGIDEVVTKPIKMDALGAIFQRYLGTST